MTENMVSVVIPTYRRPQMLREAIMSVKKQDYPWVEIIVIDDNSWEDTSRIAEEFQDVVFLQNKENRGPGYSRKKGYQYSHGEYVVFLDDDDYYTDFSFFSNCIELFHQKEDATLVIADARILNVETGTYQNHDRDQYGWLPCVECLKEYNIGRKSTLSTFTAMFSKRKLLQMGILEMQMVNDMALYMRSLLDGYVYFMKSYIGVYRVHSNNISKRITGDFVIANMEEKLTIYKMIAERSLFEDYDQWWIKQMEVTVSYYVYGSHPAFSDFRKVRRWCISNSVDKEEVRKRFAQYRSYLIDYRVCKIKASIKKCLGIKN